MKKKIQTHTYVVVVKGKSILLAFLDDCGHFFLILYQNKWKFLKGQLHCGIWQRINKHFVLLLREHPLVCLAFYSCMIFYHHWENIDSLSYKDLPNVDIFPHRVFKKSNLLLLPLIRKIFKFWEAVKLTLVDTSFPKF